MKCSVEAALDGSRWSAALSLPRVQLHLQDKTTAKRTQEKTLGESIPHYLTSRLLLLTSGREGLQLPSVRDKIHLPQRIDQTHKT